MVRCHLRSRPGVHAYYEQTDDALRCSPTPNSNHIKEAHFFNLVCFEKLAVAIRAALMSAVFQLKFGSDP